MNSVIAPGSRHRSDQGPRLTERDLACLRWIGQQYAIRFDQLQRLLLRYTPEADKGKVRDGADRLSKERTYRTLARWEQLALVECANILDREPRWIWLSSGGLRTVESTLRYNKPSPVRLRHLYATNQVRLWVEGRRPGDRWKSEREIKAEHRAMEHGEHQEHLPDAILYASNGKISALEIELEPKATRALEGILAELESQYTSILYFVSPAAQRQLLAMLATFEPARRRHFLLYGLGAHGDEHEIHLLEP
jgi:hypothetical protein